jgi:hypothetical protein
MDYASHRGLPPSAVWKVVGEVTGSIERNLQAAGRGATNMYPGYKPVSSEGKEERHGRGITKGTRRVRLAVLESTINSSAHTSEKRAYR